ncbi:hypothetical protein [uncultured Pseudomonas sp.]|uniref:hypothetical protein n=1 Tax=uncultured Pseudomonas sp. TaxID=114707 RepID=UPI00345DA7D9
MHVQLFLKKSKNFPFLPDNPSTGTQKPKHSVVKRPSHPSPESLGYRRQLLLGHVSTPHMEFWQRKKTDNNAQPHGFIDGLIPSPESLIALDQFVFAEVAFQLIQFFVLDEPGQNQANKRGTECQEQDE